MDVTHFPGTKGTGIFFILIFFRSIPELNQRFPVNIYYSFVCFFQGNQLCHLIFFFINTYEYLKSSVLSLFEIQNLTSEIRDSDEKFDSS